MKQLASLALLTAVALVLPKQTTTRTGSSHCAFIASLTGLKKLLNGLMTGPGVGQPSIDFYKMKKGEHELVVSRSHRRQQS
jgi:hypothetical protein